MRRPMAHRLLFLWGASRAYLMRAVSRPIPGAHRVAPLEALSRTERIIAFCRVLLAIATLAVVIVDPKQPSLRADLAYLVLSGFVAYSIVLFLLVRGEYLQEGAHARRR